MIGGKDHILEVPHAPHHCDLILRYFRDLWPNAEVGDALSTEPEVPIERAIRDSFNKADFFISKTPKDSSSFVEVILQPHQITFVTHDDAQDAMIAELKRNIQANTVR